MGLIFTSKQLANRMRRAAFGEKELYWELALHPGAVRQSVLAVLIVSAILGVGSAIGEILDQDYGGAIIVFIITGLWALSFWFPFSGFAYVITRVGAMLHELDVAPITYLQFLRSAGFVATPGMLLLLTPIPFVGEAAILFTFIWMVMAIVVAIQHTMEVPMALAVMGAFSGMVGGLILSLLVRVYLLA